MSLGAAAAPTAKRIRAGREARLPRLRVEPHRGSGEIGLAMRAGRGGGVGCADGLPTGPVHNLADEETGS